MFIHVDINECWNPCACPAGQKCHNLMGSHECRKEGNDKNINSVKNNNTTPQPCITFL